MNEHRTSMLAAVFQLRRFDVGDQFVRSCFAVGMSQTLNVALVGPGNGVSDLLGRCGGVTRVACRIVADRFVAGPIAPSGKALWRTVDGELRAGNAKVIMQLVARWSL